MRKPVICCACTQWSCESEKKSSINTNDGFGILEKLLVIHDQEVEKYFQNLNLQFRG
jgi:hypothetical protein